MMKPEAVIADFLMSAFTDERLAILRADAAAGKVPFMSCKQCLVGHTGEPLKYEFKDTPYRQAASDAYSSLGIDPKQDVYSSDTLRQARLIPLIDAELARRTALRAEVIEHAKAVALVTADDLVTSEVL
jgi:hypothetical protein